MAMNQFYTASERIHLDQYSQMQAPLRPRAHKLLSQIMIQNRKKPTIHIGVKVNLLTFQPRNIEAVSNVFFFFALYRSLERAAFMTVYNFENEL